MVLSGEKDYSNKCSFKLFLDKTAILVNGEEKTLDVPARLYQNTTYIPVRAVAENFGLTVLYSGYSGLPHLIGLFQGEAAFDEKAALAAFTGLDIRYVSEDAGFYAGSDGAFYFLLGGERDRKVRDYQLWGEKKAWYEFPDAKYLFFSQEGAIGSTETVYGFYPDGTVKVLYAAQMRDFVFDTDGKKLYFTTMLSPMLLIEPEQRENFDGNLFVVDLTSGEKPTAQALGEKGYAYGFTSYQDGSVDGVCGLDGDAGLTYTKDGIITTGLLYAPDMSAWQESYGQYQVALSGRAQQKLK